MSVTAVFKPGATRAFTTPLYRYDYGQELCFEGLELPETFIVHFSNTEELGTSTTAIGSDDKVLIPNEYLRHNWDHIFAWIFLGDGINHGETKFEVVIPVQNRPGLSDPIPTPVEESVIQQGISIMTTAIQKVDGAMELLEEAEALIHDFENGNVIFDAGDASTVDGGGE